MKKPEVSVVMGVYNGAAYLPSTIDSVLNQHGVDLEFIVVNDGSTDETTAILEQQAKHDNRLRIVHQANAGLTNSLIRGCKLARGTFIARQDAGGDLSLPGRLMAQVELLLNQPDAVLATCATKYVAPDGVYLYNAIIEQYQLDEGLRTLAIPGVKGPSHHGSCMFRREIYERVGGYRRHFALAQDLDLWLRLIEAGRCIAMQDVLYQATWAYGGLSSRLRPEQNRYAEMALEAARCRRAGLQEPELPKPLRSGAILGKTSRHVELSHFHYFLGSCVAKRDPALARKYFWRSLMAQPFNLRSLLRVLVPRL
jgi:glycosyltransferase involved in cell wall biosynthesis